jgi:hypothetical protein
MSSLVAYAAAACAAAAAWFIRGTLAVETAAPGASKVGILPPWWELPLFVVAGLCAVFLLKPSRDRLMPLFITVLCILPWVPGVRTPALLVWTGPLAGAVWAAAVLACGLRRVGREPGENGSYPFFGKNAPHSFFAGLGALVFFSAVAFGARDMVPGGDEPHYLILAQSILYDGDLQIENNHARGDFAPYFQGNLRPDYLVRGKNGAIYSIHAPGLSAIVAPAYAIGGYRATVVLLLLVAAAGIALVWKLAFDLTGRIEAAWFAAASIAAATPIAFHTFTIYPDGPGAVLTLTGAWALMRLRTSSRTGIPPDAAGALDASHLAWFLHGVGLGLLPWIHTRFAILAGLLGVFVLLRMARTREGVTRAAAFLAFPVVAAIAWFAYFWIIYGTPNPDAPYGDFFRTQASWSFVTGGLAGVLFDQQFGMVIYAPVFLVALAGWAQLLKHERRLAVELAVLTIPYMIATTHLRMWWGGWSAPARFSVAVLWLATFPVAAAWARSRSRAARGTALGALLVSAFTTVGLAFVDGGRMAYNVRDGYSLWLQWLSPLGDLPLGFPSFFRWLGVEWALHLQILTSLALFAGGFLLLRVLERRVRGTGAFALLLLSVYAVAGIAMLTFLWQANDATGIRPASAQIALLKAAQEQRRTAVRYESGASVSSVDDALRRVRIESPPRMLGGSDPPALVLPGWFPAGRYRISAAAPPLSEWQLFVLRSGPPVYTGDVREATSGDRASLLIDAVFPVDVPAVILRARDARNGGLTPVRVATRRERFRDARALSGRRYGATLVWFLDGNAFNEPEGLWVRGSAESNIVVQPEAGSQARLLVRNGPVANAVGLSVVDGEWVETLSLARGEEREVSLPVDPARGAVRLRVVSRSGFRPSEVDPKSNDRRFLGAWIEPR